MLVGAMIGALVGLVIGWVIAASQSRSTYVGGGYWTFEGMGCLSNLLLYLVLAGLGALVGALVVSFG